MRSSEPSRYPFKPRARLERAFSAWARSRQGEDCAPLTLRLAPHLHSADTHRRGCGGAAVRHVSGRRELRKQPGAAAVFPARRFRAGDDVRVSRYAQRSGDHQCTRRSGFRQRPRRAAAWIPERERRGSALVAAAYHRSDAQIVRPRAAERLRGARSLPRALHAADSVSIACNCRAMRRWDCFAPGRGCICRSRH